MADRPAGRGHHVAASGAVADGPAALRRRSRGTGSASTCGPGRPTWPPFRAPPGWRRPAARWPTRPPRRSATATRGAGRSCDDALAGYLARARGVGPRPIASSSARASPQALALLCEVLRGRGAGTLAVEAYGLPAHREPPPPAGLTSGALPVDGEGAVVEALEDADARPAHARAPVPARRAARAAAAGARRSMGAPTAAARHRGRLRRRVPLRPPAPRGDAGPGARARGLRRHGEQDASRPGCASAGWSSRRGWSSRSPRQSSRRTAADGALDQLTLAELIVSGAYDRQVRRARLVYRRRRDALVAALGATAPGARGVGRRGRACTSSCTCARDRPRTRSWQAPPPSASPCRGSAASPAPDGALPAALVVGYGTPPEHAFGGAVARLCQILAS